MILATMMVALMRRTRKTLLGLNRSFLRIESISLMKQYINYDIATHSIQLSGYKVESVQIPWSMFLSALLLAIFAEIYAQAIKLKEEQDLTI